MSLLNFDDLRQNVLNIKGEITNFSVCVFHSSRRGPTQIACVSFCFRVRICRRQVLAYAASVKKKVCLAATRNAERNSCKSQYFRVNSIHLLPRRTTRQLRLFCKYVACLLIEKLC